MKKIFFLQIALYLSIALTAQSWDPDKKCEVDANGNCTPTTILTGLPFLRIAPDARGGSMGDGGIVADPNAAAMHYNPSNMVFAADNSALSLNFTPWLQALGVDDLYLTYLSGFKKFSDREAAGLSLRYFSLGSIVFTDFTGFETGVGRPREFEIAGAYSRKLGDNLSAGLAGKFLYSNLAGGQSVNGVFITAATSFAADVSLTYRKKTNISTYKGSYAIGANLSNLGSKITYTKNADKDFIPTNLGIGSMLKIDFDDYNAMSFILDINKLMVPSPHSGSNPDFDLTGPEGKPDQIADQRQLSLFEGIFGSFTDAQGGFAEELKEINYSAGVEYVYDQQFSARLGYYYENPLKGARRFLTAGVGIKYNIFEFNLSYLAPGGIQRTPLDNTLRFGMNFNFADFKDTLEE